MSGVETFTTINSTYEIDHDNKRVRRLTGVNPPTEAFGQDGVWRDFEMVSDTHWGGRIFFWTNGRCTVTSMPAEEGR